VTAIGSQLTADHHQYKTRSTITEMSSTKQRELKPTWIQRRVTGVTTVLLKCSDFVQDAAWATAAIGFLVVYPFALAIVEERIQKKYS
jgi:hypothetical protein